MKRLLCLLLLLSRAADGKHRNDGSAHDRAGEHVGRGFD